MTDQPDVSDYAPYDSMPAFDVGRRAYDRNVCINPYSLNSVNAQAFDRGAEYAMRLQLYAIRKGHQNETD